MAMNLDAALKIKADVQGENNIRRLGNSMQGLQGQVKNAALGFSSLKGAVAGFGAAIAGSAIVGGLAAVVRQSINAGDELFNLQAKTGIAANALIGIGNAAKLADVDMGTLGKGLNKLNVNLVKAAEGNEDLTRKFQALGVNVKDANGQVAPADQVLRQIANRFADMPDGAQKAAAAVTLFGKSGADLIPLLNEGAAAMEEFTYKVSEDFAARSDLFNDTITELGIKTQGFGMELTDALLPALQSILEVFGDLFDTKNDFNALFEVIKGGLRVIATVIYSTIKLVDVFIKNAVAMVEVVQKAFAGDFAGAAAAYQNRVGDLLTQARSDFAQIQKIWSDSPSPGTGRRTGGRAMELDTSAIDARAAAAARKAAAEARRAANEQERLLERRASLTDKVRSLQQELRQSIEDTNREISGIGASRFEQLDLERQQSIAENNRLIDSLTLKVVELSREAQKLGGDLDIKPFRDLINDLSAANAALADKTFQEESLNYWQSQADAITKATEASWEFARAQQYNTDIMGGLRDGLLAYVEQVGTMREAMSSLAVQGFKGVEDSLVSLVTTGKANFLEFARSFLEATARMIIQQLILRTIMQAIGGIGGGGGGLKNATQFNVMGTSFNPLSFLGGALFANGGMFAQNGIQKFARGGIVDKPTLFPFANGTGLMGEAGPEAILPLRRGRDGRLGVDAGGGAGGINVTVNVDATGTKAQGDDGRAGQFARAISEAVKNEIVTQKRPGGLLA